MEVGTNLKIPFSPFPQRRRSPEDENWKGERAVLREGMSMKDYINAVFGPTDVKYVSFDAGFLDRDSKDKPYVPEKDDPFVFAGSTSVRNFLKETFPLMDYLLDAWKGMELPVKKDTDRAIMVPDEEKVIELLFVHDKKITSIYEKHHRDISYIVSQFDVLKKTSIVRHIFPGWYATTYAGKSAIFTPLIKKSIDIFIEAVKEIHKTSIYRKLLAETELGNGDPLDTNVGSPTFKNTYENGAPLAKQEIQALLEGIGVNFPDYNTWLDRFKERLGSSPVKDIVHAVAAIRRSQAGYKWLHTWLRSERGLTLSRDFRGSNTTRVAWMAPYYFNLLLSAIQSDWKTVRKCIPGAFHDGETRGNYLKQFREQDPFVFESDYVNFDRSIAPNIMLYIFKKYSEVIPHSNWNFSLLTACMHNINVIYPGGIEGARQVGMTFNVKEMGLLSGLKLTSELGTWYNNIICGAAALHTREFTERQLFDYWTYRVKKGSHYPLPKWLVQSDDTQFVDVSLPKVIDRVKAFKEIVESLHLKAEVGLGDRFLMRSMTAGADSPIPSRIRQNTISNEDPSIDPLIFCVGLGARTDGMLGYRTVDAFGLGKTRGLTALERGFESLIIKGLHERLSTAKVPIPEAVKFLAELATGLTLMKKGENNLFWSNPESGRTLDYYRMKWARALAERDLRLIVKKGALSATYLNSGIHSQYSLSGILMDKFFASTTDIYSKIKNTTLDKESQFYQEIMKTSKINTSIWS